jgi:hypothetical protein
VTSAAAHLLPAIALVAGFYALGVLLPVLGGPAVLQGVEVPNPVASAVAWLGIAGAVAGGFFVKERVVAIAARVENPTAPLSPPIPALRRFMARRTHRILALAGAGLLTQTFMPAFIGFKTAIPEFQSWGFWDRLFIDLDRSLHGGVHPWELLHPLLGSPWITVFLDRLYLFWFPVSIGGLLVLGFWASGADRTRLFLAFAGTWVGLGVILATGMASVGPCYVTHLAGMEDPYGDLMAYLRSVDLGKSLHALAIQDALWASYLEESRTLVSGIAAMPSLHVAIPALFALASWPRSRWVSVGFWGFTLLIFLGSVHLGWHYAVDGYVSLLAVIPIWLASGWVARRWKELRSRSRIVEE